MREGATTCSRPPGRRSHRPCRFRRWAIDPVKALGTDHRRIEGLIAPGTWNVDPSATGQDILSTLIAASVSQYEQKGLLDAGSASRTCRRTRS